MPRKKKKLKYKDLEDEKPKRGSGVSPETQNSIFAVLSLVLAVLAVLSFSGKGGLAGDKFSDFSHILFGWGFFIIPIAFLLLGVSFLKFYSRESRTPSLLGVGIFVLAVLGVFFIVGNDQLVKDRIDQGGYLGVIFGYPLLNFFGFTSSLVILLAAIFISFLVSMDIPLHRLIFKEKEEDEENGQEINKDELVIRHGGNGVKPVFEAKPIGDILKYPNIEKSSFAKTAEGEDDDQEFSIKVSSRKWRLPPLELLRGDSDIPKAGDIAASAAVIKRTLGNFSIDVEMGEINVGPTVTQYTLRPAVGVKLAKITSLNSDLALALASHPIRIEAPIPGKSLVGIEVPNRKAALVGLKNLLEIEDYKNSPLFLPLALGRDVAGYPLFGGLEKMPHLLIAGATGSGKSVAINSVILSLLYKHSPDLLKFIMIDPKRVELSLYNGIPHLITPVIVDNKKAINALRWLVKEMERRYEVVSRIHARDIFSFNARQFSKKDALMPFIVLIIDELADLMAAYGRDIEGPVVRLAQMSRAVGIHLIISTQRPSVEVITGLIKANITSRVAFQVASQVDSRTILDMAGAEKLLGSGDMLYLAGDTSKPRRVQGPFVSEKEVKAVVKFLKDQGYEAEAEKGEETLEESLAQSIESGPAAKFSDDDFSGADDVLFEPAKEVVIQARKASASLLQRRLRIGYARAARLLDMLEENKVVGPAEGAKPREVLIKSETTLPIENDLSENNIDEKEENGNTLV
ncbi:MAG: DNA translocase FtsK 4TM domain-containing protein [Parcubacteria group bacterium]|nr:DNA translocase FtsK 4TM domain-containing protein [Parcubacteria group bacterium]